MAAIVPIQTQPPPAPAPAPVPVQDALFEALAKYVTTGYGAQPVSSTQLQELITSYSSAPGGRAYLEALAESEAPNGVQLPRWEHQSSANGFFSTDLAVLTLGFTGREAFDSFRGTGRGLFAPQISVFDRGTFYWNGDAPRGDFSFHAVSSSLRNTITVTFTNLIFQDIAQLFITDIAFHLPPGGVRGQGTFNPFIST